MENGQKNCEIEIFYYIPWVWSPQRERKAKPIDGIYAIYAMILLPLRYRFFAIINMLLRSKVQDRQKRD